MSNTTDYEQRPMPLARGTRVWGVSPSRSGHTGEITDIDDDREFRNTLYLVRWDDPGMDDDWMLAADLTIDRPEQFRATRANVRAGRRVRNNRDGRMGTVRSNSLSYRVMGEDLIMIEWDGGDSLETSSSYAVLDILDEQLPTPPKPGTRVRGTHPSRAGWLGTVVGTAWDERMVHIRWDNPGADDEWIRHAHLSVEDVPAEKPYSPFDGGTRSYNHQPAPLPLRPDLPHVADLVVDRIRARKAAGLREYGTPLQPRNGRDALLDLLEELLDGAQYLEQAIWERDHPAEPADAELHLTDYEPVVSPTAGRWFRATCSCGWRESGMRATVRVAQQAGRDHAVAELREALRASRGGGVVQQPLPGAARPSETPGEPSCRQCPAWHECRDRGMCTGDVVNPG